MIHTASFTLIYKFQYTNNKQRIFIVYGQLAELFMVNHRLKPGEHFFYRQPVLNEMNIFTFNTVIMKKLFPVPFILFCMLASCKKDEKTSTTPVAKFSISGYEAPSPCTITFINVSENATSYQWSFGDGGTSVQSNPTHVYASNGSYLLKLIVTGPGGSDSICKLVAIEAPPPANKSAFSYFAEKCIGAPVGISFKTVNPLSTNTVWDFGNGIINVNRDPIIQFLVPGDYTIKYSSQINGVRDTVTRIIQIF